MDSRKFISCLAYIQDIIGEPDEQIEYLWRSCNYSGKPEWKDLIDYISTTYPLFLDDVFRYRSI